jgi:hypothetical protein
MILGETGQGSGDLKDRWKAGGGCSPQHFHEFARRVHSLCRWYIWTRLVLLHAGLVTPFMLNIANHDTCFEIRP